MKLIQQTKLFYKEGTSDKVYEIDLCELSDTEYIVNFRYGRRGSSLKAGTKTPEAVNRQTAEALFYSLESEKRRKGYQSEVEVFIEIPSIESVNPETPAGAILQRLQDAIDNKNSFTTEWKTSRVIWKAGKLGIQDAVPFIIKLATTGDEMQTYSAFWALIRLKATQAKALFQAYAFQPKKPAYLRYMACEGLLTVLESDELTAFTSQLGEKMPYDIYHTLETGDYKTLATILNKHTYDGFVDYFSHLYLLCKVYPDALPVLHEVLKYWSFTLPYFQRIRSIYKLAQVRKDYTTVALLSYRFEKVPNNYNKPFKNCTKAYFQRNSMAYIRETGSLSTAKEYIQLAVATLLQYNEKDYTPAGEKLLSEYGRYNYNSKLYHYELLNLPECAESILLSTILYGNNKKLELYKKPFRYAIGKRIFSSKNYYYVPSQVKEVKGYYKDGSNSYSSASSDSGKSSIIDTIKNFFGKGKRNEQPQTAPIPIEPQPVHNVPKAEIKDIPVNEAPQQLYPEHWEAIPVAYLQLLMQAQMKVIHNFAYNGLHAHSEYTQIANRLDEDNILQLLNSSFEIPGKFGFEVLDARQAEFSNQPRFVAKALNSNNAAARVWAQSLINNNQDFYIRDLDFLVQFISNTRKENSAWIENLLQRIYFPEERLQVITGKLITELLRMEDTEENKQQAEVIIGRLKLFASSQLSKISWDVIEELILSPLSSNIWLAGNILTEKSQRTYAADIPVSVVDLFLRNDIPEVRQNGLNLLNQYPSGFLADNHNFLLNQVENPSEEVVKQILSLINKQVRSYSSLGDPTVRHLVYALIRREKFEGAHALFVECLNNSELKRYHNTALSPKDITKLIHANYRESQLAGYELLKAYDKTDKFTLPQIISFGNHELLAVRHWCWNYFKQNLSRIRFEKDKALNLLDSNWDDTRQYAFRFFKTEFTEADWDTDTLISIVDSIRPDVEAFGEDLINHYFKPENAVDYLTRLSQHPSINVQAFVTNYLNHYAAGNVEVISSLQYYFRSVLSRVNKGRIAKNRILNFLQQQAMQSSAAAEVIVPILDDLSAQSSVQDKATCIQILTKIKAAYPHLEMHLKLKVEN